jgi:hypothetical protein
LLFFAFSLNGQEETATVSKFGYGIKAGTTLSSFSAQQPHTNYKPGFIAGGFLSYELSNSLALQIEPSYMQQGGNLISIFDYLMFLIPDPPFVLKIRDQRVTFHNIDFPVLLKYQRTILGLKVFGVAGPSIA